MRHSLIVTSIAYDAVVDAVLAELPDLQPAYALLTETGAEGAYIVFGEVVYPYIERSLDGAADDPSPAVRLFAFLERLAGRGDEDVRDLVNESVVAQLRSDPSRLKCAKSFMGPLLLRAANHRRPPWQYPKRLRGAKGRYPTNEKRPDGS